MIKASGIYMVGRALAALLTIASVAVFSRLLAPADYGVYTLTLTTSMLFNALFCTWVAQSVFRLHLEEDGVRLQSTGLFALTMSAIVSVAGTLTAILLSGRAVTAEFVIGLLLLLTGYSFYEYCNIQLTVRRKPHIFVQLQLAKLLLTLTLPSAAFLLFHRFDHFMLALGAAYWLPLLVPRFLFWVSGASLRHVDRRLLMSMARYGLPLSLSILLVQLGSSLDRYILGVKEGVDAVAGYAAGADLALFAIGMIASSLNQAHYPELLRLHSEGRDEDKRQLYSQYTLLFVGLLLPAAVGLHFVADDVARLITGESIRADAIVSLGLFSATAFFINFKSFVVDLRFQIAKQTTLPIVNATVTIGLLIGGCLLLMPAHGAAGAAWASLIAASGGCVVATLLSVRLPGRVSVPFAELGKILAAVTVMAAPLYGINQWSYGLTGWPVILIRLAAQIFIAITIYTTALVAMNLLPARQVVDRIAAYRARRRSH